MSVVASNLENRPVARSWWVAHRYMILRRISQFGILSLFLLGPWFDIWIVKGNLAASLTLDVLPLTDSYAFTQSLLAGHLPESSAIIGVVIVTVFYFLVGGRVYCSWVCPVNPVTDLAAWLRARLGVRASTAIGRRTRYWVLAMTAILAVVTGSIAWEIINPVSMLHRGLIYGMGLAWMIIAAVFLFDLFVSRRGWCGHLCPVGAFYSLIGHFSPLRVVAAKRDSCDDCMDCFQVCPEPQVINPALKGKAIQASPVIFSPQCTNCGRCIDVCNQNVFRFGTRFSHSRETV